MYFFDRYNYFQAYGESLTNSDVKDNKLQIILPQTAPPVREEEEVQKPLKKEDIIRAENAARIREEARQEEMRKLGNIEATLKKILSDDYSTAIDHIDQNLSSFKIPEVRLQLLQRKFDVQRNYLRALKKKSTLTIEEKSKLELFQVACFATMTMMVELENIVRENEIFKKKKRLMKESNGRFDMTSMMKELEDIRRESEIFKRKKTWMEELIDQSPLDLERWYRFQMEKVNSRLPRLEQGQPDIRISRFSKEEWNPDPWQVEFLTAIDQQQSVIIVAPTASGKTYASYYAMYTVLNGDFGSKGVCVYVAPTKALVNQVAGKFYSL